MEVPYRVRVLVADRHPGLMPFTFDLFAESRDEAIKTVRKHVRARSYDGQKVRVMQSARRMTDKNGKFKDPYDNGQVH